MVSAHDLPREWRERTVNVLSGYRFLAFGIAASQITLLPPSRYSVISPEALVISIGIYTLFRVLHPPRWHQEGILGFSLLGIDIAVCLFLVASTGGVYSHYILYTVVPVLTAAIFMDVRVTLFVAGLSITYVIGSHIINPFFPIPLSFTDISYLLVYGVAICLSAVLPYLINVNLRQRLSSEDMLKERQRLAAQIYHGTIPSISALGWQVQLLNRRLSEMNIELNESKQLEELAEKAQHNTLGAIGLLGSAASGTGFAARLKEYLEETTQDTSVSFPADARSEDISLEPSLELELMRICQEAVANIKRGPRTSQTAIFEDTVKAMAATVEMRDPYTAGHEKRVTELAVAIAQEMGLSKDEISGLRLAGLVHDIGKTGVPAEILSNPLRLSDAQVSIIKTHPEAGYDILKMIQFPWPVAKIVCQHHERLDGSGYPLSMKGNDILLEARILAVADVVEAMSSHRPYRPAVGIEKALEEISGKKGVLYDAAVVDACLTLCREKGFRFDRS